MPASRTVVAALAAALRSDGARPLVTFYDDATGERVELSVKTFDNWVSKFANLLSDELDLGPGDALTVDLPAHWLSCVVQVGAWAAGLAVADDPAGTAAGLHVVGPNALGNRLPPPVLACSLRPMAARFSEPLPDGWTDFAAEVPAQPDELVVPVAIEPGDAAVVTRQAVTSHDELVRSGLEWAADHGLDKGGRLLTDLVPTTREGRCAVIVAPLVTDSSVVLVTNADPELLASRTDQENVTCTRLTAG
ncbi:MAG: TIGR03089 family protein [Nocardioidaceae bacterium]